MLRLLTQTSCLLLASTAALFGQSSGAVYDKLIKNADDRPDFLLLWNLEGDVQKLAAKATEYLQAFANDNPELGIPPLDLRPFADALGLTSIDGVVLSSKDLGDRYRLTSYAHTPRGLQGLMKLCGTVNNPRTLGSFAPADAMIAMEMQVDAIAVKAVAEEVAVTLAGELGKSILNAYLANPIEPSAVTGNQIITALTGNVMGYANLGRDEQGRIHPRFVIKLPQGASLLHSLRPLFEAALQEAVTFSTDGQELRAAIMPMPIAPDMAPLALVMETEAGENGALYIASSVDELDGARNGTGERLKSNPAFAEAIAQMPDEGYFLQYVAPSYYEFFAENLAKDLKTEGDPGQKLFSRILKDYFGKFDEAQVTVSYFVEGGVKSVAYTDQSFEEVLLVLPAGVVAAMAIPAFQKVRQTSEEKLAINNLRMLASAADQYFVETGATEVTTAELVGPGSYIRELKPALNESYDMVITTGSSILSVTLDENRVVNFDRETSASWVSSPWDRYDDYDYDEGWEEWEDYEEEDWEE